MFLSGTPNENNSKILPSNYPLKSNNRILPVVVIYNDICTLLGMAAIKIDFMGRKISLVILSLDDFYGVVII
jgi:hypothetical protein